LVSMTRNVHFRPGGRRSQNAYVAQFERINVAFSRARELLMVFGAAKMFRDYEIKLESLIRPGTSNNLKVYGQIINYLRSLGCLIYSRRIISPEKWASIGIDAN
ncbi:MAG: hypothetical protein IJK97_08885, partial [Thermoguttaceae bacterium]|nr:hypothetical protein [Thermoguttaceae bacterium]